MGGSAWSVVRLTLGTMLLLVASPQLHQVHAAHSTRQTPLERRPHERVDRALRGLNPRPPDGAHAALEGWLAAGVAHSVGASSSHKGGGRRLLQADARAYPAEVWFQVLPSLSSRVSVDISR